MFNAQSVAPPRHPPPKRRNHRKRPRPRPLLLLQPREAEANSRGCSPRRRGARPLPAPPKAPPAPQPPASPGGGEFTRMFNAPGGSTPPPAPASLAHGAILHPVRRNGFRQPFQLSPATTRPQISRHLQDLRRRRTTRRIHRMFNSGGGPSSSSPSGPGGRQRLRFRFPPSPRLRSPSAHQASSPRCSARPAVLRSPLHRY